MKMKNRFASHFLSVVLGAYLTYDPNEILRSKSVRLTTVALNDSSPAKSLTVAVTSEKDVKVLPVLNSLRKLHPEAHITVLKIKSDSGIANQPVGRDNGILGASNRIQNAIKSAKSMQEQKRLDGINYWVSIENYIEPPGKELEKIKETTINSFVGFNPTEKLLIQANDWADVAYVHIYDPLTQSSFGRLSIPVFVPQQFVDEARRRHEHNQRLLPADSPSQPDATGLSVTIGQVIKEYYHDKFGIEVDDSDWHSLYSINSLTRRQIIEDAVFEACKEHIKIS